MARLGVFSRKDDTPEPVPRSLQLLSHRNTFDARYMEIYPNFSEILYPNESISLKVTNFVRSLPMKRPQLSRVRVYQSFVAVPLRLLWLPWEDYIKGENDAQFLYEEPYIVNATDGTEMMQDSTSYGLDNIVFDGGFVKLTSVDPSSGEPVVVNVNQPIDTTTVRGRVSRRGILLDRNSHVSEYLSRGESNRAYSDDTQRSGYMKVGVHELADYFFHPLYVSSGKFFSSGYGNIDHPFSAFKFAAYQLAYSYFERMPNVQDRQDDFYEMSQEDCTDFPSVVACVDSDNNPVPPHIYKYNGKPLNVPFIRKAKTVSQGVITEVDVPKDCAASSSRSDVLRTTWEFVEKFPLKAGANLSMLASQPNQVTGIPQYVPSNISLTRKRFANWQTDYFTSCNPWPQRGEEAQIPVSGTFTVNDLTATFTPQGSVTATFAGVPKNVYISDVQYQDGEWYDLGVLNLGSDTASIGTGQRILQASLDESEAYNNADVRLKATYTPEGQITTTFNGSESSATVSATGATVSGLYVSPSNFRFAMTLQHIKEMQAEIDNRYQSYIRKFFGARARDYRLDRPEFLGGSVMELNVSDVTQTSQSTVDSLLGDLAGKSVSANTSRTIRYHADEHTVILGLIHIMPDTEYIGGLSRIDSTQDRFDWALPQFSHLSEQAVYNWELSFNGITSPARDALQKQAFGYQPILNHLRWRPNIACGAFRDTLNSLGSYEEYKPWIAVRDFGARVASNGFITFDTPSLSDKFLSGRYNRDNSNFDVTDDGYVYPFMIDSYFDERFVRVISARGTPRRLG